MLLWDDSLATGVPEIDVQHRELLQHFNDFTEALVQGRGRVETGQMLDYLQFYAQWHFEREEKCMEAYRCPVAAANKTAHQQFLTRFSQLYEQYQASDVDFQVVAQTFWDLQKWFIQHIRGVDYHLNTCVS